MSDTIAGLFFILMTLSLVGLIIYFVAINQEDRQACYEKYQIYRCEVIEGNGALKVSAE